MQFADKKKYLILIVLMLSFKHVKAELKNSAFEALYQNEKEYTSQQRYELAKILYDEEKYTRALKIVLKLIKSDINDKELEVKILSLAGKIHGRVGDYEKGLHYLKSSIKKNVEIEDGLKINESVFLAENYLLLSVFFRNTKKRDSAKFYLAKLIEINSLDDKINRLRATGYMNLGNMYMREDSLASAEKLIIKAINIQDRLKDNISLALSYSNLASLYVKKEDFNLGRRTYQKAFDYIKNERSLVATEHKELLLDNIAWTLYNLKDYRAYEYVTESYAIRDSLNTDKLKKDIEELNAIHNVDIVRQQEQIKIEKQERKTWIIGVTGIVVSLLLLYLANLYKLRQQSLSLKLSQSQLEQQRNLDRLKSQSQVKILNATIDGKETERKQIAEILHDNVSALLSSASMHLQASQQQFKGSEVPTELAKTQEIIAEASHKIRDLSHNLMSSILLKFGLEFAVKDAAKKFSNSNIRINTAIHNVYRYSQDQEIKIFNIIQELINNILKHSQAKNAYVIMEEEDDMLNIIVKDDGIGFKNKSEEEKGVGINQIKARIHMMNGKFLIESSQGMGTKTTMNIPVVRKKTRVYSA